MITHLNSFYKLFFGVIIMFVAFALFLQPFDELIEGLFLIFRAPDILVTDYIYVGGLGAAMLNAAIVGTVSGTMLLLIKHEPKSGTISNLFLLLGFAFFGKNIFTIVPIFFGGFLYCKFMRQSFDLKVLPILVATCLSPVVTQKLFIDLDPTIGFALAAFMGIVIGFVFEPLAMNVIKIHDGFNLYNGGLTAGIIAISITAFWSSYGVSFTMNDQYSSGYTNVIALFVVCVSLWFIFSGFALNGFDLKKCAAKIKELHKTKTDYYGSFGSVSYINMGLLGIFCIVVAYILQFDIHGLAFGAILSIIGFGANGKNIPSGASLMVGIVIATLTSPLQLHDPGVITAFFFVLCLSPVPTVFGLHFGVIAGFIHLHLVTSLAVPSGGVNLYNNGLAAGFVVILILPIILAIKQRKSSTA